MGSSAKVDYAILSRRRLPGARHVGATPEAANRNRSVTAP